MVNIKDSEEKKRIIAYFLTHQFGTGKYNSSIILRTWCKWWKDDFQVNGNNLRLYKGKFVKSATSAKKAIENNEDSPFIYTEYDNFMDEMIKEYRDKFVTKSTKKNTRNTNLKYFKRELLEYRDYCSKSILDYLLEHKLDKQGYTRRNTTSKKHLCTLGSYQIFHSGEQNKCVCSGSYETVMNYLNKITGGK